MKFIILNLRFLLKITIKLGYYFLKLIKKLDEKPLIKFNFPLKFNI